MRNIVFFAALACFALPSVAGADEAATLTVNVSSFRSSNGQLGCRVYGASPASAAGFPSKPTHVAQQWAAIGGKSATCTFTGLPPGTYAVGVIHDENGNGKLDTNFLGIPTEGYGTSNNKTHALGAPSFDESKFTLPSGGATLSVTLHY